MGAAIQVAHRGLVMEAGMKAFERSFEEWGDGQS